MSNIDTLKLLGSLMGSGSVSRGSSAGVLQSVLGAAIGGQSQQGGGLGNVLGAVLGSQQQAQQSPGLGNVLGSVLGGQQQAQQSSGLGNILGSVLGGQSQASSAGALAGLLGGSGNAGLGGLLGAAMGQYGQSQQADAEPTNATSCNHLPEGVSHTQATDQATLLIRAMINAAKSDGQLDQQEEQKILGKLGEVTQDEIDFIRQELQTPLDVNAFVRSIPRGLEQQVYAMSLMAIDLDQNQEAQYLHQLAEGLSISQDVSNQIHQQMGAPVLYS